MELFIKKTDTAKRQAYMKMDKPCNYEICVEGQLTDRWSDWFNDLVIRYDSDGKTTLSGPLPDQAALFGVLNKIQSLNLVLISVNKRSIENRV